MGIVLDQFTNANAPGMFRLLHRITRRVVCSLAVIDDAQAKAAAIRPHLDTIWREHKDLERCIARTETELKVIDHAADDARDFQRNELGVPTVLICRR